MSDTDTELVDRGYVAEEPVARFGRSSSPSVRVRPPDDPDVAPVARTTALDALAADLAGEVEVEPLLLEVPHRPGYAVRYRPVIEYDELVAWRRKATEGKGAAAAINELRLGTLVLANRCAGIVRQGEDVLSDGEPLTFASPALHDLLGVTRTVEAVVRFYGPAGTGDADVIASAMRVLAEAGYGGTVEEADDTPDPTARSSSASPRTAASSTPRA